MRFLLFTILALTAFAANSILCRLALGTGSIDAGTFTSVRVASGAVTLAVVSWLLGKKPIPVPSTWRSAVWLFLYAAPFSFAYLGLTAGTGALLLFGAVQMTMMLSAVRGGERLHPSQWTGFVLALIGLFVLVFPRVAAPPLGSGFLMVLAGVSWGIYSLRGRGTADPIAETSGNFLRAVPMALAVNVLAIGFAHASPRGLLLAVVSGALASGIGYVLWYAALRGLTAARAAVVQLTVPVLAAMGGILFLGESVSAALVTASVLILGGVGLAILGRERSRAAN